MHHPLPTMNDLITAHCIELTRVSFRPEQEICREAVDLAQKNPHLPPTPEAAAACIYCAWTRNTNLTELPPAFKNLCTILKTDKDIVASHYRSIITNDRPFSVSHLITTAANKLTAADWKISPTSVMEAKRIAAQTTFTQSSTMVLAISALWMGCRRTEDVLPARVLMHMFNISLPTLTYTVRKIQEQLPDGEGESSDDDIFTIEP